MMLFSTTVIVSFSVFRKGVPIIRTANAKESFLVISVLASVCLAVRIAVTMWSTLLYRIDSSLTIYFVVTRLWLFSFFMVLVIAPLIQVNLRVKSKKRLIRRAKNLILGTNISAVTIAIGLVSLPMFIDSSDLQANLVKVSSLFMSFICVFVSAVYPFLAFRITAHLRLHATYQDAAEAAQIDRDDASHQRHIVDAMALPPHQTPLNPQDVATAKLALRYIAVARFLCGIASAFAITTLTQGLLYSFAAIYHEFYVGHFLVFNSIFITTELVLVWIALIYQMKIVESSSHYIGKNTAALNDPRQQSHGQNMTMAPRNVSTSPLPHHNKGPELSSNEIEHVHPQSPTFVIQIMQQQQHQTQQQPPPQQLLNVGSPYYSSQPQAVNTHTRSNTNVSDHVPTNIRDVWQESLGSMRNFLHD